MEQSKEPYPEWKKEPEDLHGAAATGHKDHGIIDRQSTIKMSANRPNIPTWSTTDIQKYLNGEMSAREMHDLEKTALDDPFLADAIEGMEKHAALTAPSDPLHPSYPPKPSAPPSNPST